MKKVSLGNLYANLACCYSRRMELKGRVNIKYMKRDLSALYFSEKERICESTFIANGPYWHVYTDGTKMQNIFCNGNDFNIGMWSLAVALHLSKDIRGLTFELMTNHVHLILAGHRENCIKAFELFVSRLKMAFSL